MPLGLGSNLSKTGLTTPGIVTDNLVLKHNYNAGSVIPVSDGAAFFDNSNDYISIADNDNLSFGDGTNDSAMTVSAWINPTDVTNFAVIAKNSSSHREWILTTILDKLYFYVYDNSATAYQGRYYNTDLTNRENTWFHVAATYNGDESDADAGICLYLNGVRVDDANFTSGSYTAMENKGGIVAIGRSVVNGYYAGGYICNANVFSVALTQPQIKSIMNKNYAGLTSSEKTNLVSWWNLSADANDSHGSNNGTLS